MTVPLSIRDSDLALAKEFTSRLEAVLDRQTLQVTFYGSRARTPRCGSGLSGGRRLQSLKRRVEYLAGASLNLLVVPHKICYTQVPGP